MSNTTQAISRIEAILDDSSFVEIGAGVKVGDNNSEHILLVAKNTK